MEYRWMIEESTQPSTSKIRFLLDGQEVTTETFAQWVRELKVDREGLQRQVGELNKAINKTERLVSEAIRTGSGRGEEYALGAHRALTDTGVVLGYSPKCEHEWAGGSAGGYRCTKCPAVAGKYCDACHEPMEGNRMGPCWKCQSK